MTADNNTCHRIKKFCWRSNPKSPGLLFWVFYFRRTEFSTVCSFLCTQYLVGPPFAWITASMRRGMKTISLWHCSGVMKPRFFRSSALLGLMSLIYILYEVQVRWVYWSIKHSNTMVIEPAFGTFGSVGKCQVLLENEICISIKLVSRRKHEVL